MHVYSVCILMLLLAHLDPLDLPLDLPLEQSRAVALEQVPWSNCLGASLGAHPLCKPIFAKRIVHHAFKFFLSSFIARDRSTKEGGLPVSGSVTSDHLLSIVLAA